MPTASARQQPEPAARKAPTLRVAVLASGRGSNLQALIEASASGSLSAELVLVASDRPQAPALRRAEAAGLPTLTLTPNVFASRRDYDLALFERIAAWQPDLLVLAGFMRIIGAEALRPWEGRIINIHPSLLPRHRGLDTHRRAIAAGDAEHGASVHYVNAELDAGPLIAQTAVAVQCAEDPAQLAHRVLQREHQLLPAVVRLIAQGRLHYQRGEGPWLDGKPLSTPLRWPDPRLTSANLDYDSPIQG